MGLLGVHTEQSAPFAACDEPDLRMDITIEGGQGLHAKHINNVTDDMDRGVLLDVKLTDPTCLTSVTGASKQHAHAADAIAKRNHKHYDKYIDADKYVLVPLAFEVFGGACKEVQTSYLQLHSIKLGTAIQPGQEAASLIGGANAYHLRYRAAHQLRWMHAYAELGPILATTCTRTCRFCAPYITHRQHHKRGFGPVQTRTCHIMANK